MSTRYRDGGATVTLTGDLEAWAERAIRAAAGDAVDVVRAELQTVANAAEAKWYGPHGVHRQTGRSGDMEVVTTIDAGRGIIRVALGSTDTRTVGNRGAPLAVFVHRPGRPEAGEPKPRPGTPAEKNLAIRKRYTDNGGTLSRTGDGKRLIGEFVFKPGKVAIATALPKIAAVMAAKMSSTNA